MSKRKTKIETGKFYLSYGGNPHPAKVYQKTNVGTYKAIKTGTTPGKNMIEIKPIQKGLKASYINNRPFEGTRHDYGDRELLGLEFNRCDEQIIEKVKTRKSRLTKRAKCAYERKKPSSD